MLLKSDGFKVEYNPNEVEVAAMLTAVEGEGFSGKVVDEIIEVATAAVTLELTTLPEDLQQLFSKAKDENRLVLIDIHGPG